MLFVFHRVSHCVKLMACDELCIQGAEKVLYLCRVGSVYKLWLPRNVLKCQMLVFCGLDVKQRLKTRGKLRRGRGKNHSLWFSKPIFGTGNNSSLVGDPFWGVFYVLVKEKSPLVLSASGGEAVRSPLA